MKSIKVSLQHNVAPEKRIDLSAVTNQFSLMIAMRRFDLVVDDMVAGIFEIKQNIPGTNLEDALTLQEVEAIQKRGGLVTKVD